MAGTSFRGRGTHRSAGTATVPPDIARADVTARAMSKGMKEEGVKRGTRGKGGPNHPAHLIPT